MLAMTAICIALGYVVTRPKKHIRSPIDALKKAGSVMELKYCGPPSRINDPVMHRDAEGDYYDYTNYRLFKVDLSGKDFDRSVLAQLEFCPDLVELNLSKTKVANEDLKNIAKCKTLHVLSFYQSALEDGDISVLNVLSNLKRLNLETAKVGDLAVRSLDIPSLQSLSIGGTSVTDQGLSNISKLGSLQSISLDHTKITGKGLQKLSSLQSLRYISLSGTDINENDLAELLPCQNLNVIILEKTMVTDGVFELLEKFQKLQFVHVPSGHTTEAAASAFRKEHPNVTVLWDRYENGITGKEGTQ